MATTATDTTTTGSTPVVPQAGPAAPLAMGKVTAVRDGKLVFVPANTNYELELVCPGYAGPLNKPVRGVIRAKARKIWTVPSGGNFISPIFGPPKTIQGRVRDLDRGALVLQAGTPVTVELPDTENVYDLANGPITVGVIVNVTAFAGATFELKA